MKRSMTDAERQHELARAMLVTRYAREYLDLGAIELSRIPRGGSIFPWKRRKQMVDALNRAEVALINAHPYEWAQICDYLDARHQISVMTPEDFR